MKDKERINECKTVHLYVAIRRKKDNKQEDMEWRGELCFRRVIRDEVDDLEYMRTLISRHPGIWRIYKTVNSRDVEKARKLLITKLVNEPEQWNYRVDSLWKTCLLQPECKAERKFLIDVDTRDNQELDALSFIFKYKSVNTYYIVDTPNGIHYVTDAFDTRVLDDIPNVEIKKDGYVFIDRIHNNEK